MELTPEEKRRIYEEVKAKQPPQIILKVALVILLIIVGYIAYVFYSTRSQVVTSNNNYNYQYYQPTPQSNTPTSNLPVTPSAAPASSPVTSEEDSLRQIMLAADQTIKYQHLTKNADRYQGNAWTFTGSIVQIQESDGLTSALVALDAYHNDIMKVKANFTTDFVEKDRVYVVGYLAGNYSYTSVGGYNMTLPAIDARAILKPADAARIKAGKKATKP